jgi:MinD-like ATPase involved in chromosome partitioning or flagellar assembly
MEVITFYSYKGGVGRTLLLSNIADFLSKLGKKIFILDFDLEAPGIHHKFKLNSVSCGFVDFLIDYFSNGLKDKVKLSKYVKVVNNNLYILPAGNSPSNEYAETLSHINWHNFYYQDEENITNTFFKYLFESIEHDYSPDYLLIDARTGLSDIGGYIISKYTDKLVCLLLNNPENISGTSFILKSIRDKNKKIEIYPIISRIPDEKIIESVLINIQKEIEISTGYKFHVHYLHSQPNLEIFESIQLNSDNILRNSIILQDYILFLDSIFPFEDKRFRTFTAIIKAKNLYKSSLFSYNYNNVSDKNSLDAFDSFKQFPKKILRAIGPKYYLDKIFNNYNEDDHSKSGFNDLILDKLKNSLGFSSIHNIKTKDINWDLLGVELQEKAFDFCRDIYYLTPTRSHLSDILQIGRIQTYTLFVYSESPIYRLIKDIMPEINRKGKEQKLNYCFKVLNDQFNDIEVATIGDQAAASETYRLLSKLRIEDDSKSFYEKIKPKKNESELLDWIRGIGEKEKSSTECLNSRIIICDHVTAHNVLLNSKSKKNKYTFACSSLNEENPELKDVSVYDSDLEFKFINEIPAGYIYLKDNILWRYYLAKAISEVILEKGGEPYWNDLSNVFIKNKIIPFSFEELKANIIWDLNVFEGINWVEKINNLSYENSTK